MIDEHGVLWVNNSALSAFKICQTKGVLGHHLHWASTGEKQAAEAGKAAHLVLSTWLKTRGDREAGLATLTSYEEWAGSQVGLPDRLTPRNLRIVMETWLADHPYSEFPFTVHPDLVEVSFACPLDNAGTIMLTGTMDALGERDGAWWVIDWKTTARFTPSWKRAFRLSPQGSGYVHGAREHLDALGDDRPVAGFVVGGIELIKVPDDAGRRCRTHGNVPYLECGRRHIQHEILPVQRTVLQLAEWRRAAVGLARQYRVAIERVDSLEALQREVPMDGAFAGACGWCEYFEFCGADRRPEMARLLLQPDAWRPWRPGVAAESEGSGASE